MKTNPIELELFRHLLASICEEMGIVLRKTAFSANIKERRDYSCAIYDRAGETVAMGDHMPVHLGAMPLSVRHVLQAHELGPGDVAIVNDPFRGGTHLPDITAVAGVFLDGAPHELMSTPTHHENVSARAPSPESRAGIRGRDRKPSFFVANRAHHADVGGMSPGSMPLAREIYQEGIRIPPVLLVSNGEVVRDLLKMLLANVRTPVEREGDLRAQLMSLHAGQTRLRELVRGQGAKSVREKMRSLVAYSERMMRATLKKLPDGDYQFEDCLDDDGLGHGPVGVKVKLSIRGERAVVDFSESDAQAEGPINANRAITMSATAYVFRCLLGEDVPFTDGLTRPIEVITRAGSVVDALPPAAMAAGNVETSQRITDVVLGALSKAAPELIPAASSGTMNNLSLGGYDPFRNRPFAYYETIAGGMGASAEHDGLSATHTHMTNSWNTPIEAFEHQFPMRIHAYRIRSGSGGNGRRRGGDGLLREVEFLTRTDVTILSDRRKRGPYGLAGGGSGRPGANSLIRGRKRTPRPGKTTFIAEAGDRLRIETPGAGGYG